MLTKFNIIVGIIMLFSFTGMILCLKKKHTHRAAKPAIIVLLLLVITCAIMILSKNMSSRVKEFPNSELKYAKAQTYILGKKLLKKIPPATKVLIICEKKDPDNDDKKFKAMMEGFKEAFGNKIYDIKIDTPKVTIPKGSEYKGDSISQRELMKAKDFNKLIKQNPTRKLIITMIGLPKDLENLNLFRYFARNRDRSPKLVMVGGDISFMEPFISLGLIPALVTYRPDAQYTETNPDESLKECFDKRYLLITKENLKEIKEKYPDKIFRTK
jgi:hypothetical protein